MSHARLTYQAASDLEEIEDYISRDNPDAAARVVLEIRDVCDLLAKHPEAGDDRSELRSGMRGFPVGNYIIFYHPVDDGIEVIRVLHGARDVPKFFE
jgi:toxin ParE1/3/4